MSQAGRLVQNISDTARWAAVYRARENERPDAVFRDPYARRLAGPDAEQIAESLGGKARNEWAWVTRTYLYDQIITEQVRQGADMVVNLAAGLDARPYRMALPESLRWVEVDLPALLAYKEDLLKDDVPKCALERVALDLSNVSARRELFERLGSQSKKALIITEGLLIYLSADEVGQLATDLASARGFERWVLDLASPGLLQMLQSTVGPQLTQASAALKFGPPEGPGFFTRYGWNPVSVNALLKTAARLKRLSFGMRLLAMLPASDGAQGKRPWGAVCLFSKSPQAGSDRATV
jgi:methyltransferase (TIGR00027 family)